MTTKYRMAKSVLAAVVVFIAGIIVAVNLPVVFFKGLVIVSAVFAVVAGIGIYKTGETNMRDPIDIALDERDREEWKWEQSRPVCKRCKDHILDDFLWDINGDIYCEDCADRLFRKDAYNYENER